MNAELQNPARQRLPLHSPTRQYFSLGSAPLAAVCGALALTASMANFLSHNNYPLLAPEVLLVVAGLVMLAAAVGYLYTLCGKFGRIGMEFLLVALFVDLNFDGREALFAALIGTVVLKHYAVPLLGIVSATVLATTVISSGMGGRDAVAGASETGETDPNLPVLLHLVLDEHLGVEGFRDHFEPAARMGKALKTFYTERGFRVFGGAYSEYRHTVNAIPHMLNFGETQPWQRENVGGITLNENRYFDRLRALGYHLRVYQTDFLDYCGAKAGVELCMESPKSDFAPVSASSLPVNDKAVLIIHGFLALSEISKNVGYWYDMLALQARRLDLNVPLIRLNLWSRVSSIGALEAFDRLIVDLRSAKPGQAYFAHLLFPHYPYVTDQHCALKRVRDWEMRMSPTQSREAREIAYFAQLRCATVKVDLALQALTDGGLGNRSIVIVHGDHGSRISQNQPTVESLEVLSADDLISHHLTLFAVRSPGIDPGYESRLLPVHRLIQSLATTGFRSAEVHLPRDFTPMITLEDHNWRPVQPCRLPAHLHAEVVDCFPSETHSHDENHDPFRTKGLHKKVRQDATAEDGR